MNLTLIVNPVAGRGRGKKAHPVIERHFNDFGLSFKTFFSKAPGHGIELAREASKNGSDVIVACGGDGTFHEIINGAKEFQTPVGLIPCGTGDDIASNLGIPRDTFLACQSLVTGVVRYLDIALAGDRFYACVAGAGFDSMVNRAANEGARFLRGTNVYIYSLLKTLISFKPIEIHIEADGLSYKGRVMFVVAANASSYGGGMKIAPMARMDDGMLDLLIIEEISRFELLRVFPQVFSGKHVNHTAVKQYQAKKISMSSPHPLELFADGEYIQDLPVTIEAVPKALPVIVPRRI